MLNKVTAWLLSRPQPDRDDRGDVPGWVMVTVMSAVLVVAILGVFEQPIKDAITGALSKVTGSK